MCVYSKETGVEGVKALLIWIAVEDIFFLSYNDSKELLFY